MAVNVPFNGNTYSIPESRDTGWFSLTDYLVALSSAASTTRLVFPSRTATTTPQTLQSNDTILLMNVASASSVTLPAGTNGIVYGVIDSSGNADTNNITVTGTGGQTINGAANYVINSPRGGALFQYSSSVGGWILTSEYKTLLTSGQRYRNAGTNPSFVDASITRRFNTPTITNLQSCSADFGGSEFISGDLLIDSGVQYSMRFVTTRSSTRISVLHDSDNFFCSADSGSGIYISKTIFSPTVSFKNRTGAVVTIEIRSFTNQLSNITGWA